LIRGAGLLSFVECGLVGAASPDLQQRQQFSYIAVPALDTASWSAVADRRSMIASSERISRSATGNAFDL